MSGLGSRTVFRSSNPLKFYALQAPELLYRCCYSIMTLALIPNLSVELLHPGFMYICFFNRIPTLCANFEMIKKKRCLFFSSAPKQKN